MPVPDIFRPLKVLWLMLQTLSGIMGARTDDGYDLRSVVTERQLEEHLSDPDAYIWQLAFWENDKLRGPPVWLDTEGWLFEQYTRPQQVLLLVGQLDAQVLNGGFSQLFYNRGAATVSAARDALGEIGCGPAAELVELEIARFRQSAPDLDDGAPSTFGWDEFMARHFPPGTEEGDYGALRDETMRCVLAYMRANADEIFDVRPGE